MKNFKVFIIISIIGITSFVYGAEEKKESEKVFTQAEFDKELSTAFKKRMKILKKGELVKFTNELFQKEKEIYTLTMNLKKEQELIKNSRKSLKAQISKFHKEQNKFLTCRSEASKKRDKRVRHMVDVISGMKPLTASEILSVQDANIAISILSRLDAVKVSKIFNLMDKEISARLQKQYMTMQE